MSKERYIRQLLLDKIGETGQRKLLSAHVVIIGCGGLGSIAAPYLAGAGVGKLTLVDGDVPHISNLHRQVFFNTKDKHVTKSMAIAQHIQKLNPEVELDVVSEMASKVNIKSIISNASLVLECTDNVQTKYLVNDLCHLLHIPLVYAAIHKYEGYISLFDNKDAQSVHLRDAFPVPDESIPSCSEVGVLGTIAGIIGIMQANEAIKYLTEIGNPLIGKLLTYDALDSSQSIISLKKVYMHDMHQMFESNAYQSISQVEAPEITLRDLFANRSEYKLISILDESEHESIDKQILHMPLNTIDPSSWSKMTKKPSVFYCKTGARSASLVASIKSMDATANVYSLKGGLMEYKNRSNK